jgi:wobble nucleotide-excising tRNase
LEELGKRPDRQRLKKLNIIYGRKYSGKTTLSRLFRTLEEKRFPANFDSPDYSLHHAGGTIIHSQIATSGLNVRVYNKDFVHENLSFLVNQYGGEIKTFAIVGALNIDLVHEIEGIETSHGSVDSKAGLRYEQSLQDLEKRKASTAATRAEDGLAEKLRRHANDVIKPNREYGRSGYNINDIASLVST